MRPSIAVTESGTGFKLQVNLPLKVCSNYPADKCDGRTITVQLRR